MPNTSKDTRPTLTNEHLTLAAALDALAYYASPEAMALAIGSLKNGEFRSWSTDTAHAAASEIAQYINYGPEQDR